MVAFCSVTQSCLSFETPWTATCQASLSITYSQSLFKLMSISKVMPFNHWILISCHNNFRRGLIWYFRQTPGESEGQVSVAFCSQWDCKKLWQGHDLATGPHQTPHCLRLSQFQQHVFPSCSDPCSRTYRYWCQYIYFPLFFQFV